MGAAIAKVTRLPVVIASGLAVVIPDAADATASAPPIREAPMPWPRLRDRLSIPDNAPR